MPIGRRIRHCLRTPRVDLARFTKLTSLGAAPSQNVDTLKAQVASLEATVLADEAMIDTARLNLGFTSVTVADRRKGRLAAGRFPVPSCTGPA